ncbi:hypothetical protein COO60DRAFT_820646 [Scenedesmus sp. NREL 46B-D3]|nr:hypothetical protein COO60DRAFT_820646 [Scenedesmus sp. NREL 46B-D3]
MSRSSDGTSQRHQVLTLWCLMLLAAASSVKALPAAQGIWEDHTRMSRRLLNNTEPATDTSKPAQVATWDAAPSCGATPTAANSTPGTEGRLWGWNTTTETPCAFKDQQNRAIFYVDYAPAWPIAISECGDGMADTYARTKMTISSPPT